MMDNSIFPSLNAFMKEEPPKDSKEPEEELNPNKKVRVHKQEISRHRMRRITSEANLEKELPWHFEPGDVFHCISWGDVDSLTYFRVILKQQKIKYAAISTWCMATEDIKEIEEWLEAGIIRRVDFYCGEIFKGSYSKEYELLIELEKKHNGRVVIFRNHSKVMVIIGERFDAVIESSANVNTNPRTEQTTITIDSEVARFYKETFDGIKSFERNFDDVEPAIV